ncbi:MAG: beta-N-acetylhexosaminidase [Devosia sp.]|nr:beta-N-acetylhexosaminidase [Devosia sp.]
MASGSDLRLVSVWHGPEGVRELHYSLYNNGKTAISDFTFCLTGTLWLTGQGSVRGGTVVRSLSNFIEIKPDVLELANVWTFAISGLNEWPRHSGDGAKSAYVRLSSGEIIEVGVQPMTRSHSASNVGTLSKPARRGNPVDARDRPPMSLSVIPFPNVASVAISPLPAGDLAIELGDEADTGAYALSTAVDALARRVTHHQAPIFVAAESGRSGFRRLVLSQASDQRLGRDGYKLTFDGVLVQMEAQTKAGFAYGLITLAQMIIGARTAPDRFGFPVRGTIADVPRFDWRGLEVDVARTFYPVAELKSIMDVQAWLKLNVLHLHLTDDEGWRIEVDGYPEIAEIAAWRGHDLPLPPLLGSPHSPYGGAYSADEIRDLTKHGDQFGITLVPEVDIPGHAHAALVALPQLREPGDGGGYHSIQGFFGNALNPCLPATYDFLDAVFTSVASRFASDLIHIGGDEIAADTWAQSPAVKAAIGVRGLKRTGDLQALIIDNVHVKLKAMGKRTVVWEDALRSASLDPQTTTAVVWQHPERAFELAERGFDVVLAPGNAYYLDMASSSEWRSPGGHWAGPVSLEQTYDFEPGLGWPAELLPKLRGVQACIWGEHMVDRSRFDTLVFPRIYAYAERAWIDRTTKDFEGFLTRLKFSTAQVNRAAETLA